MSTTLSTSIRTTLTTERLTLQPLSAADSSFIRELVNTEGWLTFIGDRNVHTDADATAYIKKITDNAALAYWTVHLRDSGIPIAIITFIKRDYLPHHDIGFALLPAYASKGYAYEAAQAVLTHLQNNNALDTLLATTLPDNVLSIKLLQKLGLRFEREIEVEGKRLLVYGAKRWPVIL
jgi:RimJ/RimL family protein N-acetyltransferase